MNPYASIVRDYARSFREGRSFPMGGFSPTTVATPRPGAPKALIFSPHPDDECIIGGLALRLLRECGWNILNVAVTQGSNRARQSERWTELQAACAYMGFGLIQTSPNGLEKVTPKCRAEEPAVWAPMVERIAAILRDERPKAIFVPHAADWNGTHIGTHHLVRDALATLGPDFQTVLIETEYWGQMVRPNLMVEISDNDLTDLVTGISFHAGEVRRNPFHLLLPAWMQDNVRRGSELVGGQGGAAPDFGFATLYRRCLWKNGSVVEIQQGGLNLGLNDRPDSLFTV